MFEPIHGSAFDITGMSTGTSKPPHVSTFLTDDLQQTLLPLSGQQPKCWSG